MPRRRPPYEVWVEIREKVWNRDNKCCTHCHKLVSLKECNIDHIKSGKLGTNKMSNLRTLCHRCHVLRNDGKHRGMISKALRKEIIPPTWRQEVWDE